MSLPVTIRNRDGKSEAFDPDKLARSLFAATEATGSPNPFLARELTDGVLHFLTSESSEAESTEQLAELTTKVVRELGYPALARAYCALRSRPIAITPSTPLSKTPVVKREDVLVRANRAAALEKTNFSLDNVYPRDVSSAHREGLLQLLDLETPFELSGLVLPGPYPTEPWAWFELLREASCWAGQFVVVDGLDAAVAAQNEESDRVQRFSESFTKAIHALGLQAVVNLNAAEPPPWMRSIGDGPLFADVSSQPTDACRDEVALHLLEHLKDVHIIWHLSERDFISESKERMRRAAATAIRRDLIAFVFDHPRQPIRIGPGLRRGESALVGMVGVNMKQFVGLLGGGPLEPDLYLRKLGSLARFAKSAGHARQDFLKRHGHPRLREAFLLDRAVELVAPIDLDDAVQHVAGNAAEVMRQSLAVLQSSLAEDRHRILATAIDYPLEGQIELTHVSTPVAKQLKAIASCQKAANGGKAVISLKPDGHQIVQLVDLLQAARLAGVHELQIRWLS